MTDDPEGEQMADHPLGQGEQIADDPEGPAMADCPGRADGRQSRGASNGQP